MKYIPDTGASISVISEEVAKTIGLEIKPYDSNKVKAIKADGKEVKDILGFAEVDVILGNKKMEKVKMLLFKNATYPCLIGGDVFATHPDTKQHFEALLGSKQTSKTPLINKKILKQSSCNIRHCDRSSDDDYDEMDDKFSAYRLKSR